MLSFLTGREASAGIGACGYVRHRPERTLLYQIVEAYHPVFPSHVASEGTELSGYVEREFEECLKCSRLEHDFQRMRCDTCHAEYLVTFGYKRRGFYQLSGTA